MPSEPPLQPADPRRSASLRWVDLPVAGGGVRLASRLVPLAAGHDPAVWFDPAYPLLQAAAVSSGGRQAAWFVQGAWGSAVLRHYRRGGLVARVSQQHYVWQGAGRTRSFAEFALLDHMAASGLPVPEPLGAVWWRSGLVYRAAIVVARIQGARTLATCLDSADPGKVAEAIFHLHQANVWHADLNAYNILLDACDHVWLIDFDRGRMCPMPPSRRAANLARLRRSLCKVSHNGAAFASAVEQAYRGFSGG